MVPGRALHAHVALTRRSAGNSPVKSKASSRLFITLFRYNP